ncbi:hypothetical protein JWJ90_15450 [Desulfobulbus rhabdoformis]|uniref:3-deoxy-D-manno-octulosonic acid transferase n=1 Tax=Desulfobulbus rhabdoformis TaxID=34032 RepID=UPI00196390CC|nr:glycosyltransferase N-terminal domain-containing protein [Desulfobulbus rhabdoformis]MBM9615664.1 hypothetical protein [Desulfobulbus rhabdoformis]
MLYLLYSTLGYALHAFLVLLLPMAGLFNGRYGYGLCQRYGLYNPALRPALHQAPLLWVHASSVGEVQAALILIHRLLATRHDVQIVLSTTTAQGRKIAASRLGGRVCYVLAPLDFPPAVRSALQFFRPTLSIGLKTELWPVMLTALNRAGVPKLLLNGRLSERSLKRYLHIRQFICSLIQGVRVLAVITPEDRDRFVQLGVRPLAA